MCSRAMAEVIMSQQGNNWGRGMESEFYWNNFVMPVMNKKYGDMKSSDTERLWIQFKSERY